MENEEHIWRESPPSPDSDQEEEKERELPLERQEDESEEEGITESSGEEDEEGVEEETDESTEESESSEPELPADIIDELPIENLHITEPTEDNKTPGQPIGNMSATPNTSSFATSSSQSGQQPVGKRVKVPDPQPFKGDPKTARTFIAQLTSKVMGSEFENNENLRVRYATGFIHEDAAEWLVTFIGTDGISYEFTNYINFVRKFKAQFVDPNPKATAARKLFALKQGPEDIQTYLTKVIPIAREADLGLVATKEIIKGNLNDKSRQYLMLVSANLSDETLQSENLVQFKERVGRVIRRMENETSSSAIHAILRMDARHSLSTKTVADPPKFTHPTYTKSGYYGPAPMNIGRVPGPLTSEEKQRRRAQGLCLYCGKAGHLAKNCQAPGKRARLTPVKQVTMEHEEGTHSGKDEGQA